MRLLIIGNLEGQFGVASKIALARGASVRQAKNVEKALEMLRSGRGADLIMIDVKDDIKGLVSSLAGERMHVPVIGCGFDSNKELAVQAIRDGAKEYIPLPPDKDLIAAVFEAIAKDSRPLLFKSLSMQRVVDIAEQVAKSNASILITSKSGTGKEVMAKYIHQKSNRADKPFISINCAAIPENLLESELFGHEKGAFTGAVARRIGKFEESNNGTLLLDEISEIDIRLQAKLLRALQEQEIDRVGGSKPVKLNLRIIATSNRDLKKEVAEGKFREDLYFRLNIINLQLPNLVDRKEDIELLASFFIAKYSKANGLAVKELSNEAKVKMLNYAWPGNVRELENAIYRAILLSKGEQISVQDLMLFDTDGQTKSDLVGRTVQSVEKDLILSTVDHCYGDTANAANILGITLRALQTKLQEYEKV
jgi:two-component system, response regulator FlrC